MKKILLSEYTIFGVLTLIIIWFSKDYFFFWDAVQLTSKHAHWYFEQGFSIFFLPEKFDSGHPPFWGMYHAFLWNIFGKKLIVSHFAVFPFVFGSMIFASKIGDWIFNNKNFGLYFGIFLLADPVFLTQSIIVSPDIALCFFFLISFYGILKKPKFNWFLIVGGLGLSMISLRGMMTLAGLGLFSILDRDFRNDIKQLISFSPGIIVGLGFLILHSLHTKWIGYHTDSPWAESFVMVDIKGVVKNIVVLFWRILDTGRVFLFIGMLYLVNKLRNKPIVKIKIFIKLFISLSIFLIPSFLLYKGLNATRYLMPLLLIINFVFLYLLFEFRNYQMKFINPIYLGIFALLFLGNIWMYPKSISMSWDTTLQHLPYYQLRNKMMNFIANEKIPIDKIASAFPNKASLEMIDLNGIDKYMLSIDDSKAEYYLFSNIMNDVKNDLLGIREKCTLIKRYERGFIFVELYKK